MNVRHLTASGVAALLGFAAQAETISFDTSLSVSSLNLGDAEMLLTPFNPALGTLTSATLTLGGTITLDAGVENLSDEVAFASMRILTNVLGQEEIGGLAFIELESFRDLRLELGAFDGAVDFDGVSGITFDNTQVTGLAQTTITDNATLGTLLGTDELRFGLNGLTQIQATGLSGLGSTFALTSIGATDLSLSVEYEFTRTTDTPDIAPVPVPSGLPLLALGICGLVALRRKGS